MNDEQAKPTGLALLRLPFPPHQISKLPKPTKQQTEAVKANYKEGIRCDICGTWHHPKVVHLDYVGHAALTDRLLDADPEWNWEPVALTKDGLPMMDANGGMWIKLTVCGVTRLGYGHAGDKTGGDAIKEVIGDCLVTGTLITTARGDIPIESVAIGDLVPTSVGWRPVVDQWLSAARAPVITVRLSDGRSITGTPHHKVPTSDGVKRLSALRHGDTMHGWPGIENYRAQRMLSGTAESIGVTRHTGLCIAKGISWQRLRQEPTCTETFTRHQEKQYLLAGMFITMMKTGITTALKTLSRLILGYIVPSMPQLGSATAKYATNAGSHSPHHLIAQDGAPLLAKSAAEGERALHISNPAHRPSNASYSVTSATPVSYQQNHGRDFVPLAVVEVSDAGLGEVWNLSIDEVHEYVANGVLVCNCLRNAAMRFGAALDLWHKGDLHLDDDEPQKKTERPALPPYPDGNMAINLPDWRRHVLAGKNPADIISMIATKYALTDEQKRQIMALKPDTATGEIGDPMRVTFAQLAGRFAKARDMDMLDADADLIQYVEDAAQRGELKDMHKKRRAELGGGE